LRTNKKGVFIVAKHILSILSDRLTVCRLNKEDEIPSWALKEHFVSITRTAEELSIIAPEAIVPDNLPHGTGWRPVKVEGPLELTLSGLLASLISPLGQAGISVLAIATYDTDYFLVKETHCEQAASILRDLGHQVCYKKELI
jgi:hypothetical protein